MTTSTASDGPEVNRFELLVQSVTDYAIYLLDPTGVVVSWNAGAQRFKGYAEQEIVGQHFSRFYTDEDRAAGIPRCAPHRRAGRRPVRGRGLARSQGRHAILGQCRHRSGPRS
jgi:PAS domain S-box-containing protein